ncbi:MAG TPA: DUF6152 family protein [Vicinamibacterales bacterium]
MNAKRVCVGVAAVMAAAIVAPVIAHHSSAPFYDPTKTVEVTGEVTKLHIKNPHSFLYVDVMDKGQKVEWQVEMGTGAQLARNNLTVETLKPGTQIKVSGQPSRAEGSHGMCCIKTLMKADGSAILRGTVPKEPGR